MEILSIWLNPDNLFPRDKDKFNFQRSYRSFGRLLTASPSPAVLWWFCWSPAPPSSGASAPVDLSPCGPPLPDAPHLSWTNQCPEGAQTARETLSVAFQYFLWAISIMWRILHVELNYITFHCMGDKTCKVYFLQYSSKTVINQFVKCKIVVILLWNTVWMSHTSGYPVCDNRKTVLDVNINTHKEKFIIRAPEETVNKMELLISDTHSYSLRTEANNLASW